MKYRTIVKLPLKAHMCSIMQLDLAPWASKYRTTGNVCFSCSFLKAVQMKEKGVCKPSGVSLSTERPHPSIKYRTKLKLPLKAHRCSIV